MKFSWQSLNNFINLNHISVDKLASLLNAKGFEIDEIHEDTKLRDYILDISITANRRDTLSIVGLAQEIKSILNIKFIEYNQISQYNTAHNTIKIIPQLKYLSHIRINKVLNLKNFTSPLWLTNYLNLHDIKSTNLLIDITEYIKVKWGHEIHLFPCHVKSNWQDNNFQIIQDVHNEHIKHNNHCLLTISSKSIKVNTPLTKNHTFNNKIFNIIICSYNYRIHNISEDRSIYNQAHFNDAYNEALRLLATFGYGTISKSYINIPHNIRERHTITINKSIIQNTLGPINNSVFKYLKVKEIQTILEQLELEPQYNYYTKNFHVNIPIHRSHDLKRQVDIIEEIGRIYGYEQFIDKIPQFNTQNNLTAQYKIIKHIRKYFRDIGLYEVINTSLQKNYIHSGLTKYKNIKLYNPILDDQSTLRNSLIHHIIQNKIYNYKQKNSNIEIFEIGTIFHQKTHLRNVSETINISGLLGNNNFIKTSWSDKTTELTWLHAKGILEKLFEQLQIRVKWEKYNKSVSVDNIITEYYNLDSTTLIRNYDNNEIIGILGEINQIFYKELSDYKTINIFEIQLNALINALKPKSHLSYTFSYYSVYPSVIRDISIKVSNNLTFEEIRDIIYSTNKNLIHKIELFNEYKNTDKHNSRFIGIRITYNSIHRTLNSYDLQQIDEEINYILTKYNT
uniref:phenylalanine--tRNA ligase n=1 Tax=Gayliella sp. TaxID=2575623 RepID=A0A4D6WTA5_9FLOR|nr:Phenylalanine-tRNA ligase beta subunit [Gayliella sp.]